MLLSDLPDGVKQGFTMVATSLRKLGWKVECVGSGSSRRTPLVDDGNIIEGKLQLKEPLYHHDFENQDHLKDHVIQLIYADKNLSELNCGTFQEGRLRTQTQFVLACPSMDKERSSWS